MYEFLDYETQDVMTREPVTIAPDASLREAEKIFERHDFNALPVLGPGGEVVGLLSKLDVLRAFRFTDFLYNYLLGGLGGDASELYGLNLFFNVITQFHVRFLNLCSFQCNFTQRIFQTTLF